MSLENGDLSAKQIEIKVEFGGGLELLFGKERNHEIVVPKDVRNPNIRWLIGWLKDNKLKERVELFVENETVRPGILVLINDTDWELEGEEDYVLKEKDEIVFISTLHGG